MKKPSSNMNVWNPIWETVFQTQDWGKYPGESLIQFVARNYYKKTRKDVRILEIGCGPGANIWFLAREGFNVSGIDGSATAIAQAKKRLESEQLSADLNVGDIINLPFEDGVYDGVIDNECLYCMTTKSTNLILKEILRVLKPGGLFYSRTFSTDMTVGKDPQKISNYEYSSVQDGPQAGRGFLRLIDRNEIERLYGSHFTILSVEEMFHTRDNGMIKISEWVITCQKA